ncbi:MAG TPA: hypothetical protein VIL00_11460 [Pseudonocardiaceae bacterium]
MWSEIDNLVVTVSLARRTSQHWVMAVRDAFAQRPATSRVLLLWLEGADGVAPGAPVFRDALRCHGFEPFPGDVEQWVLDPWSRRVHATRSREVLRLAERLAERTGAHGGRHPLLVVGEWLTGGATPEDVAARIDRIDRVAIPEQATPGRGGVRVSAASLSGTRSASVLSEQPPA